MEINILYSTDNNYFQHACVSLISLLENNKSIPSVKVFIIDNQLSDENINKLSDIVSFYERNLNIIRVENILNKKIFKDNFPKSGYARLFISNYLKDIDKILYIDCDTIITNNLSELWSLNLENYLVAGVQDTPAKYNIEIIGMTENDKYINSGVMLMNLKAMREVNIEDQFISFINKYKGSVPHEDQGIINGVCKNKILILNPKYNAMSQFFLHSAEELVKLYDIKGFYTMEELRNACNDPIIVHYISKFYGRPWSKGCSHPLKNLYIKYYKMLPWKGVLIEEKMDVKIYLRKKSYKYLPFKAYTLLEKILDKKRKKYLENKYCFLKK